MRPIVLVLLIAHGILAAPSIGVTYYDVNEVPRLNDNGQPISPAVVDDSFTTAIDEGAISSYEVILFEVIKEMANLPDANSQAITALQTIGLIGELVYGIPGNSCQNAALVNAYASGNSARLRAALANYVQTVGGYIDAMSQAIVNPNGVKYLSGPSGSCLGGGRSYQFEEAWNAILSRASDQQFDVFNQAYCAAKRLAGSPYIRNNNVALSVTAATIPPVSVIAQNALGPLSQFLRAVGAGANPIQAGANAKVALSQALSSF